MSARYNAQFNPDAYCQEPITIDGVLSGRMIADPFTKLQCCIRSDGGCAIAIAIALALAAEPGCPTASASRYGCSVMATT